MKCLKVSLVLLVVLTSAAASFADPETLPPQTQEEIFSAQGTILQVDGEGKILHVKIVGGLEATFHTDDQTLVKAGEEAQSFADLAANDLIGLEYFYNGNYEKVARTITRLLEPDSASSEKTRAPAA